MLTAEGLLQAPELHGCPVGRESDVVEVGWREKDKDTDEIAVHPCYGATPSSFEHSVARE